LERFDVVTIPAFVAEFESVRAFYMREHIAPVVVMLNEVALRESHTVSHSSIRVDSVHRDRGHSVVLGAAAQNAFNSADPGGELVQGCPRKRVRPRSLSRYLPGIVERGELRHGRCRACEEKGAEQADVDTILLKTLIDASEILRAVADLGRTE